MLLKENEINNDLSIDKRRSSIMMKDDGDYFKRSNDNAHSCNNNNLKG